jgi:hypothetical protein
MVVENAGKIKRQRILYARRYAQAEKTTARKTFHGNLTNTD